MGKSAESPQSPNLRVPRTEAADKITIQIQKGLEIRNTRINSPETLEEARTERSKWRKYTTELLKRLFDTSSYADEFNPRVGFAISGGRREFGSLVRDFVDEVKRDIAILESIADRLELIPEPGPEKENAAAVTLDSGPSAMGKLFDVLVSDEDVKNASRPLFLDGHYAQSIFEAFKVVNLSVKKLSRLHEKDGKDLMFSAFSPQQGPLRIASGSSISAQDEQEGFMHIYAGAMQGIRNPKAHDAVIQTDPVRTLQYLALASLLVTRAKEAQGATC